LIFARPIDEGGLYRTVGIPTVDDLAAFYRGAYAEVVELFCKFVSISGRPAAATRNVMS